MSLTEEPPKTVQGALIQLDPGKGIAGVQVPIPNIVQFDINPEDITRNFTPWKPETEQGAPAPGAGVQPITVPESIKGLKLILDPFAASTSLIPPNILTVEARLNALRKMIEPTEGIVGDLLTSVKDLVSLKDRDYERPEIAPVILWLGPRIILLVEFEAFDIVEHQHNALYYPIRATVTLNLKVITPDRFHCAKSVNAEIAIATYEYTRAQANLTSIANTIDPTPIWRLIVPV